MLRSRLWLTALLVLAIALPTFAQPVAQLPRLPGNLLTVQSALNGKQQKEMQEFITKCATLLASANEAEVMEARVRLTDPVSGSGASPAFTQAYSAALGAALLPMLDSETVFTRLNAAIVIATAADGASVVALVTKAQEDTSPGVRYWAGHCVALPGRAQTLTAGQQKAVLDLLVPRLGTEPSPQVSRALLSGLSSLTIPQAGDQLLDALNARISLFASKPELAPTAEKVALVDYFSNLAMKFDASNPNQIKAIRAAARTMYLYLALAVDMLERNPKTPGVAQTYQSFITAADDWLAWSLRKIAGVEVAKESRMSDMLKAGGTLTMVKLAAQDLQAKLTDAKFGLTADDLKRP